MNVLAQQLGAMDGVLAVDGWNVHGVGPNGSLETKLQETINTRPDRDFRGRLEINNLLRNRSHLDTEELQLAI